MTSTLDMAEQERIEFGDLLADLSEEEWATPSLCTGWTVRDVVAHAIGYDELGLGGVLGRFVRAGFNLHRTNARMLEETAARGTEQLVALYRKHARPAGVLTIMGGRIALLDGFIHQQDVRRPLGRPRDIPAERVIRVLEYGFAAPPIPVKRNAQGLRLVATDLDWTHGDDGPEVRGPGEALLMSLAGRAAALVDLSGEGLLHLTRRLTTPT